MLLFISALLQLGDPETVQIAVGKHGDGLFLGKREVHLGRITGGETFALAAAVGLKIDPLNEVLVDHGMGHGADIDLYLAILDTYDGNMLFMARLDRAGLKAGHLLTAAHHGNARIMHHADDVSAMLADVKFGCTHSFFLRFSVSFLFCEADRSGLQYNASLGHTTQAAPFDAAFELYNRRSPAVGNNVTLGIIKM